jgi:sucrose-6-phosphate hydrolase SacC (GH32 family)
MRSTTFTLGGTGEIGFLIGGGNDLDNLYVALIRAADDSELMRATNTAFNDSEVYSPVLWNASAYLGQDLYIKVVDNSSAGWGHINVDGFDVNVERIGYEIQNPSFETGDLTGWTVVSGTGFSDNQVTDATNWGWGCCFNPDGTYHFWGAKDIGDAPVGEMHSSPFILAGTGQINFLIGGGNDIDNLYVALMRASDDTELMRATNTAFNDSETYSPVVWDASAYLGEVLYFKVVDSATSGWGHINVDGFQTLIVNPLHWPFDEGTGAITEEAVSGTMDTINYVFNDAKFKPDSDPLWRDGVASNALLFDGYSTWIQRDASQVLVPGGELTLEAWVAPRSYEWGDLGQPSAIVNQHDQRLNAGYVLGMGRHGAWTFQLGTGSNWHSVWADAAHPLVKDEWSYIVATFDGAQGLMRLYLNGAMVGEATTPPDAAILPSVEDFIIGRHNQAAVINGTFRANMFNGLIDELRVRAEVMTPADVQAAYDAAVAANGGALPVADTAPDRSRFDGDRYRPQYHVQPAEHWMNEPHAPIYWNGQYHIFYQHNPQGPYWHQIHWGHMVSDDMVHWQDLPVAIAPQASSVAPDGVWSGSATTDADGNPVLFITAGDDSRFPNQATGMALPAGAPANPLVDWELHPDLVTVQEPGLYTPVGEVWMGQFRDPFVWRETGADGNPIWYQLVGSGIRQPGGGPIGGTALLYSSTDLVTWTYHQPLFIGDVAAYPATGHVWELPVLLPLGQDSQGNEKHIFLINPWFESFSLYNVKYVFYWVGEWDRETYQFIPDDPEPQLLDYGEHFTGPSGHMDAQGRTILWTITQDNRTEQDHYDAGWAHSAGLPVVLSLLPDDTVGIAPIPELQALRANQVVSFKNKRLEEANAILDAARGQMTDMLEIVVELKPETATQFGVTLRRSADGREETLLFLDTESGLLTLDRNRSSLDPDTRKGMHSGPFALDSNGKLTLHIYVDRSMIEAYAGGRKSMTTRVYPTLADSIGVQIWANGSVKVKSLDLWVLNGAYGLVAPSYYPPAEPEVSHGTLPNADFQTCDLSGWIVVSGNQWTDANVTDVEDWGWNGVFRQANAWNSTDRCHLWGFNGAGGGDDATGVLRSQTFTLGGDGQIDFLTSGGYNLDTLYVALVRASDGAILFKESGNFYDSGLRPQYQRRHWDASAYLGEALYIEIVDQATGGWGHISADDFNVPTAAPTVMRSRRYGVSADTFLSGTQPQTSHGGAQTMWVGFSNQLRPLLKADVSICPDVHQCIPSDAVVDTAYLYVYAVEGRGFPNWVNSVMDVSVHAVQSAWAEGSANWTTPWNAPGGDVGPALDTLHIGSGRIDTWWRFDVTEAVAAIVDGRAENNGFALTSNYDVVPEALVPSGLAAARYGLAAREHWNSSKTGYLRIMYRTRE